MDRPKPSMPSVLEKRIRTFAFNKAVDLDEATYKVLAEVMYEISVRRQPVVGLFDALFSEEQPNVKSK